MTHLTENGLDGLLQINWLVISVYAIGINKMG